MSARDATALPVCETAADVDRCDAQRARVVGQYVVPPSRKPGRGRPPTHAVVRLSDGTDVMLEPSWSAASKRADAERDRFVGKRVEVTGVVHRQSPEPPEPFAYVVGPCISPVEAVRAAGSKDP